MFEDGKSYKCIITPPSIEYFVDSQGVVVVKYANNENLSKFVNNFFADWHLKALQILNDCPNFE